MGKTFPSFIIFSPVVAVVDQDLRFKAVFQILAPFRAAPASLTRLMFKRVSYRDKLVHAYILPQTNPVWTRYPLGHIGLPTQ